MAGALPGDSVAVIDIGSNSARVVVYRRDAAGKLRILSTTRAALRLVRDVDAGGGFTAETAERVLAALADFRAVAVGAGASRIAGIATAAMRDAPNGPELVERVRREVGVAIEVIDGQREALYGFTGGLHGLSVQDGLLFDMGGGSMQVSRFRGRALLDAVSLPLGALRLSQQFLESDPPTPGEVRRLRRFVREHLDAASIPRLPGSATLVGTGGTVRNLAKIDRRALDYPIPRVHGYRVQRRHVHEIAARLAATREKKRDDVPGLSDERGDSIVGGALGIETLMEVTDASEVVVAGQGVREGLALSLLAGDGLAATVEVRRASLASLCARFDGWDEASARRRARVAESLFDGLEPSGNGELREALATGATLLDIGRSIDFFDRHAHTAEIVVAAELDGFTHREIALVAAVVRCGREEEGAARYRPLVSREERANVQRAGLLLALADDIEERCPGEDDITLSCGVGPREAVVTVPGLAGWRPRAIAERFASLYGKALVVRPA